MSNNAKCVCGHPKGGHAEYGNGQCTNVAGLCQCLKFRRAESVYERARHTIAPYTWRASPTDEGWELIATALDAGEAAEKRAEAAERLSEERLDRIVKLDQELKVIKAALAGIGPHPVEAEALALLKPARPEDGLLPAIRDVLQQLELEKEGGKEAREECERLENIIAELEEDPDHA